MALYRETSAVVEIYKYSTQIRSTISLSFWCERSFVELSSTIKNIGNHTLLYTPVPRQSKLHTQTLYGKILPAKGKFSRLIFLYRTSHSAHFASEILNPRVGRATGRFPKNRQGKRANDKCQSKSILLSKFGISGL